MILVERPFAFLFLLLLIPLVLCDFYRYKKVVKSLGILNLMNNLQQKSSYSHYAKSVFLRIALRFFACVCAVLAFAGISWGTKVVPVQKSGDAVALVFDISYSMNATDAPGGLTRLNAAKSYVQGLLERMSGTSVSIVLAKGDGVVAVPLTDDKNSIDSILNNLSPLLMTASGSSIGKGISCAIQSFSKNSSQNAHIWVFTDGDETDNLLLPALEDAARFGFPVTMVGFGTARPVEITAGDGVTKVKTFLNAEKMIDAAATASKKILSPKKFGRADNSISYVAADSEGSAYVLLNQLSDKKTLGETFEVQRVSHHKLFIFLSIIFFSFSFIASELDFAHLFNSKKLFIAGIFVFSFSFMSCRSQKASVLAGNFDWLEKEYQSATARFLRSFNNAKLEQDQLTADYCSYNLASTYIMQEEYEAALSRLEQVSPETNPKLQTAVFYNLGIIAGRNGDFELSREYFKKAVLADSSNINARLNLEFVMQQLESQNTQSAEKEMTAVSVDKNGETLSNAVFTLIQQEEQERWQKLQSNKKDFSVVDY